LNLFCLKVVKIVTIELTALLDYYLSSGLDSDINVKLNNNVKLRLCILVAKTIKPFLESNIRTVSVLDVMSKINT